MTIISPHALLHGISRGWCETTFDFNLLSFGFLFVFASWSVFFGNTLGAVGTGDFEMQDSNCKNQTQLCPLAAMICQIRMRVVNAL